MKILYLLEVRLTLSEGYVLNRIFIKPEAAWSNLIH